MSKLIKLRNGAHIRPECITSIKALPTEGESNESGGLHRSRVIITTNENLDVVTCQDNEDAQKYADELAALVNESEEP